MNSLKFLCYWLVFAFLFIACEKHKEIISSGAIVSFQLEASRNPGIITNNVVGDIEGDTIFLNLPAGISLNELVATFTFEGSGITVDGIVQESGVTPNDFDKNLEYVVTDNQGTQRKYTVVVHSAEDKNLVFLTFGLEKSKNTFLKKDYSFSFQDEQWLLELFPSDVKTLVPTFTTNAEKVFVNNVLQSENTTPVDFSSPVVYTLVSAEGLKNDIVVSVDWRNGIPHIYIETDNNAPIVSRDDYLSGVVKIDGKGTYDDFEATTRIKGRGNSTWQYPKKPYRLKLDGKASVLGLKKAKDWVLLANYLDGVLMLNSVAMKTGALLELGYVNTMIPVDVTINGEYMGNYMLTEQVEVDESRLDIKNGGVLLELDSYFDEDYKYKSAKYDLPVMVKYPELENQQELAPIRAEFNVLEERIADPAFPENDYRDYFDVEAMVNYLMVFDLCGNFEINHPKSVFMHKPQNGKYTMGPLWDFDWAFGYKLEGGPHFTPVDSPLFLDDYIGGRFFGRLMSDPENRALYKKKWNAFKTGKLPLLLQHIDQYADLTEASKEKDYEKWKTGSGDFKGDVLKLKEWLQNRANAIDNNIADY